MAICESTVPPTETDATSACQMRDSMLIINVSASRISLVVPVACTRVTVILFVLIVPALTLLIVLPVYPTQ